MEHSMEQVAKSCGKQLDTFQRCILANQQDPSACDEYRGDLSRCASDAVPLVAAVKRRCEPAVRAYDRCLAANTHKGDDALAEACTPMLGELWRCTEAVKREEMSRVAKAKQTAKLPV